jgi:VWFA-related protein
MKTIASCCVCLILAATPAFAQQTPSPTSPQTFRTDVDAVEIDVRAVDEQGRPVPGLTANDFEVFEDGRRQDVRVFTAVTVPSVPRLRAATIVEPDTQSNREAFNGRVYVFVLDDLHTHPLRTQRVKAVVRHFLDRHFASNDRAAIVTTSGRRDTVQELTSSATALYRALDAFTGQQLRASTLERVEAYYRLRSTSDSMTDKDNKPVDVKDPLGAERAYQARRALNSLRDVARWLDSVPARRKALIFVSEGIDYDINDVINNAFASGLQADVREVLSAAARSNATIYAVDPRGLAGFADDAIELSSLPDDTTGLGQSAFAAALRWTQDNMRVLADETGGFAILNTNDVQGGFDRIVRENSEYYVLGYESRNTRRDGRFRTIDVRISRPGVRAIARRGYVAAKGEAPKPDPTEGMRALIDSPVPVSGLPIDSTAAIFRGPKDKASVLVTVEIGPAVTLTGNNGTYHGKVNLSVVAVDLDGKVAAAQNPVVTMNLRPTTLAAVTTHGLRATSRLELKPGRYQLRIAAKDGTSGKAGSVLHDLVVPDFAKAQIGMSQLLVASRGATRIATTTLDPMLKEALDVPPTAIREFDQADVMTAFAEVYDNRTKGVEPVLLVTTVTGDQGIVAFRSEERVDAFAFEPQRHAYRHRVAIPMRELAPGRYVLRMTAQPSKAGAEPAMREVAFTVAKGMTAVTAEPDTLRPAEGTLN